MLQARSRNAFLAHRGNIIAPKLVARRVLLRTSLQEQQQVSEPLSVWLPSQLVERDVLFQLMPDGKGQAVVVVEVAPDGPAAEAGIVKGQRLVGISDPVRDAKVWELGDRPSMNFIKDTLRMRRRGQVQLVLGEYLNVTDPNWAAAGGVAAPAGTSSSSVTAVQASGSAELGAAGQSMDDGSSLPGGALDSMISASSDDESTMTLGEKMAAQYAARQRADNMKTEVQKRIERRQAYMEEVEKRNDSPFVLGLLVAFLGPAAIILAIAAGTGYLDRLYVTALTLN